MATPNKTSQESREHHWWPVALQKFWADNEGNIRWLTPTGKVQCKKVKNRKVARKANGHRSFSDKPPSERAWHDNFEYMFGDADRSAPELVRQLLELASSTEKGNGQQRRSGDEKLESSYICIAKSVHRKLLLLLMSLLIRSPAWRQKYSRLSTLAGLPPDENVGKGNMRMHYLHAQNISATSPTILQKFTLLKTTDKTFCCGDGYFDLLTGSLSDLRISGRALVPLTPNLCVVITTLPSCRRLENLLTIQVTNSEVGYVNELTQVYSKEHLFFVGDVPRMTEAFAQNEFLEYQPNDLAVFDMVERYWASP